MTKEKSRKRINYLQQKNELDVALACHKLQFPLMLRGPTGVGKTTLVYSLSEILNLPLVRQICTEDTLPTDLIGANYPEVGWIDGSAAKSLREENGSIYYADEIAEARQNTIVVIHSLAEDERVLELTGNKDTHYLKADNNWMLIASYNPGYQMQDLKPSLAQRFITMDVPHLNPELEERVVDSFIRGSEMTKQDFKPKTYNEQEVQKKELVRLANDYRNMAKGSDNFGLREGPGTSVVERTAALIQYGLPLDTALEVGMINPLTYDLEQKQKMFDAAEKVFRLNPKE